MRGTDTTAAAPSTGEGSVTVSQLNVLLFSREKSQLNILSGTEETEEAEGSPTTSQPGTETEAGMAASLEEITTGAASPGITTEETGEDTGTGRDPGSVRLLKRDRGSTWLQGVNKQRSLGLVTDHPISPAAFLEEPSLWIL